MSINNGNSYHEESRLYTASAPDSVLVHWECSIEHYQTADQMYTERQIYGVLKIRRIVSTTA